MVQDRRQWSPKVLLAIAYLGFVSLGLPDTVAGVAWPSVRKAFDLPQQAFGQVFLGLGVGYCASSFFGGTLLQKLGVGRLLIFSTTLVVVAMFGNAMAPSWWVFVGLASIWGLGSGAIDAGINAHVSARYSPRHVNWLHACYSLGATLGPFLMTAMLVGLGSWRYGYALVGTVILGMTFTFVLTRDAWGSPATASGSDQPTASLRETLAEPVVWFQVAAYFVYTGIEFTAGQWSYTILTESRGIRPDIAGFLAGAYFASIGLGRLLCGWLVEHLGIDRLVRLATFTALAGAGIFLIDDSPITSALGLLILGLGLAPVFPCLMARTPELLPPEKAQHASGFQVSAAMVGASTLPFVAGLLAGRVGLGAVGLFNLGLAVALIVVHEARIYWSR